MVEISFLTPCHRTITPKMIQEFEKDLVHFSLGSLQSSQFKNNKIILRSFEFCINKLYEARSLILGFNRSLFTRTYDFMIDIKAIIPVCLFYFGLVYE